MTLKRDSRIVKWAYLFSFDGPPKQTSLCAIFWRTVLVTPLIIALGLTLVSLVAVLAYTDPVAFGIVFGVVVACLVLTFVGVTTQDWLNSTHGEPSVVRDGYKAVKSKICPIVQIEEPRQWLS